MPWRFSKDPPKEGDDADSVVPAERSSAVAEYGSKRSGTVMQVDALPSLGPTERGGRG